MSEYDFEFGKRLRNFRLQENIQVKQMCIVLDLCTTSMSHRFAGRHPIRLSELHKLKIEYPSLDVTAILMGGKYD